MSSKFKIPLVTIWQDRDIRFDVNPRLLRLISGEHLVDRIDDVEDTKGNCGDKGVLRITNLRLMWHVAAIPRINLSLGYNTVSGVTTRITKSRLRGQAESLYVLAYHANARFEFIFTCINPSQTKLFTTVIAIHRAYETSKLYRELKMRGALINDEQHLRILPEEQQCDRFDGVWNLGNDQGTLGVMILTNIRIAWFATTNVMYNVSIPYLQVLDCRVRNSRFGLVLVIETSAVNKEYVLGFRVDPEERLKNIYRTICALQKAYVAKPIFGVQHIRERSACLFILLTSTPQAVVDVTKLVDEDVELDNRPLRSDAYAAYFSDGVVGGQVRPPVYSEELGVAIEELKPGFTLTDLWKIRVD
uniref:Bardet-Biedl syndrome 5 protein homolog n=1 Tax=Elaeophora elaphi TaxID=1147741 RepID=A0A0R3RK88_9BILA